MNCNPPKEKEVGECSTFLFINGAWLGTRSASFMRWVKTLSAREGRKLAAPIDMEIPLKRK